MPSLMCFKKIERILESSKKFIGEIGMNLKVKKEKMDSVVKEKDLDLSKLIPNIVTFSALCLGLTAVRYAINGQFLVAVTMIIIACFLDGFDGKLARMLNASSEFGAQLDSLADFFNFGVAPALVVYFWKGQELGIRGIAWGMVMFFSICMAIRLARFNVSLSDTETDERLKNYFFVGVPAPVGAGLLILPMIFSFYLGNGNLFTNPVAVVSCGYVIGLLLISRFPTFSLKKVKVKREYSHIVMMFLALFIVGLVLEPWIVFSAMGILYIALLPVSYYIYYRIEQKIKSEKNK